jgi:hypothetical protein
MNVVAEPARSDWDQEKCKLQVDGGTMGEKEVNQQTFGGSDTEMAMWQQLCCRAPALKVSRFVSGPRAGRSGNRQVQVTRGEPELSLGWFSGGLAAANAVRMSCAGF